MKTRNIILVLLMLVGSTLFASAQKVQQMNSPEISLVLKKNPKIIIIDVRTPEEFAMGHIKGAKNIDIRQQDFNSKIDKLDKNATYLVYCRTNHRSGAAIQYMTQSGFKNLYQMMDGFPGWAGNNLPAEK